MPGAGTGTGKWGEPSRHARAGSCVRRSTGVCHRGGQWARGGWREARGPRPRPRLGVCQRNARCAEACGASAHRCELPELLCRSGGRVEIRMALLGPLAIGALELLDGGVGWHPEQCIAIIGVDDPHGNLAGRRQCVQWRQPAVTCRRRPRGALEHRESYGAALWAHRGAESRACCDQGAEHRVRSTVDSRARRASADERAPIKAGF